MVEVVRHVATALSRRDPALGVPDRR